MRTQDQNPAFHRFNHLLPESGLYPARFVDIFSDDDDKLRFFDVEAVFVPRGPGVDFDPALWDAFAAYTEHWPGDLGNSVAGWMEPGGLNPAKVFGMMLTYGFTDQDELLKALAEFAHIEECDWARRMVEDGLLADVLVDGAQNTAKVLAALEHQQVPWAKDMVSMMRIAGDD